jgi:hypothetical protein
MCKNRKIEFKIHLIYNHLCFLKGFILVISKYVSANLVIGLHLIL